MTTTCSSCSGVSGCLPRLDDTDNAEMRRVQALFSVADDSGMAQVGAAADVAAEALRCVDVLRECLRKTARAVAGAPLRPRVMVLESVKPLTLGLLLLLVTMLLQPRHCHDS